MSIYDNLTDRQVAEIISEAAMEEPSTLTTALRNAGNFVYIIIPNDIRARVDEFPDDYKDLENLTTDEIANALADQGYKLNEVVDYNAIVASILEWMRVVRKESNNG